MKIAIASDHAGYALKQAIIAKYDRAEWDDLGTHSEDSVDYPDFGHRVGAAIGSGALQRAVIICGSGIGISIAANRHKGCRAALCTSVTMARLARFHNDANVLALGARLTGETEALDIIEAFLDTKFQGGRHETRLEKIDAVNC